MVALSTADTNNWSNSFSKKLLVALSTVDTNKWQTLLNQKSWHPESGKTAILKEPGDPESRMIHQRQRILTDAQAERLVVRYGEGATVYQLAEEFDIHRHTVSERVRKAGVQMRLQSPSEAVIEEMLRLYGTGLSLANVGKGLGFTPGTVHRHLRLRGVQFRDTHGRWRPAKPDDSILITADSTVPTVERGSCAPIFPRV
jgi:DNA-binding CsgD family transcriptional regulator